MFVKFVLRQFSSLTYNMYIIYIIIYSSVMII